MLLGAVLVLLVLGGAGTASAHAALRATDPDDGSVLRTAPRQLTLTFTESVGLLDDSVRVLGPDGRRLRLGEAEHEKGDNTARVTLPRGLDEGTYTVAWRVVSADSHPVSGAFTFSVGKPSPTLAAMDTGPTEDPTTAALHKIARYLAYLAAALLIGTGTFIVVCGPPDPSILRRPLAIGWWTLVGTTLALLLLRGPYETGEGPGAAFDTEALTRTLTGRPGMALLARLGLLLLAAALLIWRLSNVPQGRGELRDQPRRSRTQQATLLGTAIALAFTWAASDHASAGIQVPLAMASSASHLLATAVWLGGLTALLLTLRRATPTPETVTRFSRLAFASVTVLVVTGVYQSWRGLGSWNALTETTYGRLLTLKLVAVVLLLGAAAVSRSWTARLATVEAETTVRVLEPAGGPPLPEDPPPPPSDAQHRALRRSVLAEVAVGVVVLVITTVLTATLPGRAAAEAATGAESVRPVGGTVAVTVPFDVGTPGGTGKVELTLDPGRVGDNSLQAVVFGPDGGLSTVPELRVSFTLPAQDVGPLDAGLTDQGGYWANSFVNLPLAGTWTMKVTVRVSEIDQVSVERRIEVS
ncbi:transport integral membrane protein [Streptomyces davaonensis JCM 4913]|uniref:Protein YobA n=1 Tax=Streptomyces davaonensis (strain DSM 101723 / JCM 4913 / KCC S-0913 / 768) TaxID=1214101 RepID=K4R7K5_STRDJ|nr:copper resistance protein CopC [Streptomyces davaonensis]CCK29060.1 transport integral membrane protein [Streptomyces davaonensis JCM 4913]